MDFSKGDYKEGSGHDGFDVFHMDETVQGIERHLNVEQAVNLVEDTL